VTAVHPETPLGSPLATVTGYGPYADAIRADVDGEAGRQVSAILALHAERDRYRAVLEAIRDGDSKYGDYARQLAREALEATS
jgi:hypothetical protein